MTEYKKALMKFAGVPEDVHPDEVEIKNEFRSGYYYSEYTYDDGETAINVNFRNTSITINAEEIGEFLRSLEVNNG